MTRRELKNNLVLTEFDLIKLKKIVEIAKRYPAHHENLAALEERLDTAQVVSPGELPSNVVNIETTVSITDLDRSEQRTYKLVFPREASRENHLSVAAPLGCALLGRRIGEVIELQVPAGRRRIRVDGIARDTKGMAA